MVGLVGAALLGLPAAAAAAGPAPPSHAAVSATRWGLLIGLGAVVAITLLLTLVDAEIRTLIVGHDNRVSTSKTVAVVWTVVVAAALIALIYANLMNHPEALTATDHAGVVGQYALLFGGPLGAAILAKGIVQNQNKDEQVKDMADAPKAMDLVADDDGQADLGDFQYVLFNLVALVFVVGSFLHDPTAGLPHMPDVLLGLTSVSAVGYVGKKALPAAKPKPVAEE